MNTKLAVMLSLVISTPVYAQSFDCAKASTSVEKSICSSDELKKKDEGIAYLFNLARQRNPNDQRIIRTQRAWLKERDQCATTHPDSAGLAECLGDSYNEREDYLDPAAGRSVRLF